MEQRAESVEGEGRGRANCSVELRKIHHVRNSLAQWRGLYQFPRPVTGRSSAW